MAVSATGHQPRDDDLRVCGVRRQAPRAGNAEPRSTVFAALGYPKSDGGSVPPNPRWLKSNHASERSRSAWLLTALSGSSIASRVLPVLHHSCPRTSPASELAIVSGRCFQTENSLVSLFGTAMFRSF